MSKVRVHVMMSLDGYMAGPNMSREKPFGNVAEGFLDWLFALKAFREMHGAEGGETGPSDDVMRQTMQGLGATVMGRNMFGLGPGPWPQPAWNGWWGEDPPFINVNATTATAEGFDKECEWSRNFWKALEPYHTNVYVNFLMEEGEERVRQAYGAAKYDRLKALKRKYDPDNFFRLNQNINPS